MAVDHNAPTPLFLAALYCEEEEEEEQEEGKWAELDEESKSEIITLDTLLPPPYIFEHDSCWDDEELQSLFSKERETSLKSHIISEPAHFFEARKQALDLILRISSYHGFSASATVVAANFVDRFLFDYVSFERDRPWLMQLVAVSCLSLAAKVEETHVPLLVHLQVQDAKYLFESKTIQRMELLILSALKWRMNPVTPLSFVDHVVRRLRFKSHVFRLEFLRSCGNLILSLISDSRSVGYFPSVLATATMLHVVHQVEYCGNAVEFENTILDILNISKEEVEACNGVILDLVSVSDMEKKGSKRKFLEFSRSRSRSSIIDDVVAISDTPNDSSSSSSSPRQHPISKKTKLDPNHIKSPSFT